MQRLTSLAFDRRAARSMRRHRVSRDHIVYGDHRLGSKPRQGVPDGTPDDPPISARPNLTAREPYRSTVLDARLATI